MRSDQLCIGVQTVGLFAPVSRPGLCAPQRYYEENHIGSYPRLVPVSRPGRSPSKKVERTYESLSFHMDS